MLQKPFDTLHAVNTLIRLYKEGYTTTELARYFESNAGACLKCLRYHKIPIRSSYAPRLIPKDYAFAKLRYKPIEEVKPRYIVPTAYEKGKYDDLFKDEMVNEGKNYHEYLQEQGIKLKKNY